MLTYGNTIRSAAIRMFTVFAGDYQIASFSKFNAGRIE
jgi:hypothetical protein